MEFVAAAVTVALFPRGRTMTAGPIMGWNTEPIKGVKPLPRDWTCLFPGPPAPARTG